MMRKRGFTLVELLVVMAIISILASIVVPQVVKYIAKARVTKAQAEVMAIEGALTRMVADADRTSLTQLFNPGAVPAFLGVNNFVLNAADFMYRAQKIYTDVFYALLREGRAALADSYPDPELGITINFNALLNADVVGKLGSSYLPDIGNDPWGNKYEIFPGPWPSKLTLVSGKPVESLNIFRIYQVESKESSLPGGRRSKGQPDNLTRKIQDPVSDTQITIGLCAPRDKIAFIYSMGANMVSGQAIYQNSASFMDIYSNKEVSYQSDSAGNYQEQEDQYTGGGDDINNWDNGASWMRLYN